MTEHEFRRQLAYARKNLAVLELHNHFIDQMSLGQLRHAVMDAAKWLVREGALAIAEDALWLRFSEILEALRAVRPASFGEVIAARRADYARVVRARSAARYRPARCQAT